MHEYSINSDKVKIYFWLAFAAVTFSGLIHSVIGDIPFVNKVPVTPFLIFWGLYIAFDRWGWKLIASFTNVPNLNGTWEGSLKSSYDGFQKELKARLEIKQTWSKISIRGTFNQSTSKSNLASIITDGMYVKLFYAYENEGDPETSAETMVNHNGYCSLELLTAKKELKGNYFNNPASKNNNHGKLNLTFRASWDEEKIS